MQEKVNTSGRFFTLLRIKLHPCAVTPVCLQEGTSTCRHGFLPVGLHILSLEKDDVESLQIWQGLRGDDKSMAALKTLKQSEAPRPKGRRFPER